MTLVGTETVLPKRFNEKHPEHEKDREQLRKALRAAINSPRVGSTGHIVRWQVNQFGELESAWGRLVRA